MANGGQMRKKKTIIIINDAGGSIAAMHARSQNDQAKIILIEKNDNTSSKLSLNNDFNIDVMLKTSPLKLDMESNFLHIATSSNKHERLSFDAMVYACTWSKSYRNSDKCFSFPAEKEEIINQIKLGAKKAIVVGANFCGLQAAGWLKSLNLSVKMIDESSRILDGFSLPISSSILKLLEKLSIDVMLNKKLASLKDNFDLVIDCLNNLPDLSLLVNAGAAFDERGHLRIDEHMRTTLPNIYACGYAIMAPYLGHSKSKEVNNPFILNEMARMAGINAASDSKNNLLKIKPFMGTRLLMLGDLIYARTGLSEGEAKKSLGFEGVLMVSSIKNSHMYIRMLIDISSQAIIGAEIMGNKESRRIIDLLACSVRDRWHPDRLCTLDLASDVYDDDCNEELKEVAQRAALALDGKLKILDASTLAFWIKEKRNFKLVEISEHYEMDKAFSLNMTGLKMQAIKWQEEGLPVVLYGKLSPKNLLAQQILNNIGLPDIFWLDGGQDQLRIA